MRTVQWVQVDRNPVSMQRKHPRIAGAPAVIETSGRNFQPQIMQPAADIVIQGTSDDGIGRIIPYLAKHRMKAVRQQAGGSASLTSRKPQNLT